jgi:hypothetical protein
VIVEVTLPPYIQGRICTVETFISPETLAVSPGVAAVRPFFESHDEGEMLMTTNRTMRVFALWIIVAAAITAPSCKKDAPNPVGPPPGGGGGGGGSVSDSSRAVVLDSLTSKINQLPQVDRDADNLTIYQYVRTLPEFSATGIRPSGVWARFQDGRFWVFVNNLYGTDTSWNRPEAVLRPTASHRLTKSTDEELPQNNGARIMNALGTAFDYSGVGMIGFTEVANNARTWLQGVGYSPVTAEPTVDGLKQVRDDGVFYMSAHGDSVGMPDGSWEFGLWTGTQVSPANDLLYKADLDSGYLGYITAAHIKAGIFSKDISETHYAITSLFVRKYMRFGPRSLVFVNACLSGDQKFRDACIAKGADLYLGWSNYVEAYKSARIARFFFDRALGANVERPVLSPPQKGYQIYDVLGFMNTSGRDFTVHPRFGRADLLQYPMLADVTLLRPLIYYVSPSASELRIGGWFGSDPGQGAATVRVGSTVVPIRTWVSASTIICEPVHDGGDVVVSVRGRKSTPAPLTKFSGTYNLLVRGRGSLTRRMTISITFVADVRSNRVQVDQSPTWVASNIYDLQSSGGTFEASGEYRDQQGNLVETWSGSGSVTALVSGVIDPGGVLPTFIAVGASATFLRNGSAETFGIPADVGMHWTQMTGAYEIPGYTYAGGGGTETTTGQFSAFTSTFAPTASTPR